MGQSFSTIVIRRKNENRNANLEKLMSIIRQNYNEDKSGINLHIAIDEVANRGSESLIIIYSNEKVIKIEDLTDTIERKKLEAISKELETEILRATNSDTVGVSVVLIYDKGELIREISYGLDWDSLEEMQKYIPDATEKDVKSPNIGEKTKYESNGSDAISVIHQFENELIDHDEYKDILASIFKLK